MGANVGVVRFPIACEHNAAPSRPWRHLNFLLVPARGSICGCLRQRRPTGQKLHEQSVAAMKLSLIRSACSSLRTQSARPGSGVGGLQRRCPTLPAGPANSRLILRTASATTSGGTERIQSVDFRKRGQKEDRSECESSLR